MVFIGSREQWDAGVRQFWDEVRERLRESGAHGTDLDQRLRRLRERIESRESPESELFYHRSPRDVAEVLARGGYADSSEASDDGRRRDFWDGFLHEAGEVAGLDPESLRKQIGQHGTE